MTWELDIKNIAGILEGETTIESGLNAVRAENWRGKSSLILAIEAAMGTRNPLTDGADSGCVTLTASDRTVELSFTKTGNGVSRNGTPYLEDPYDRTCASLYAFLTEKNPIREAVRNGDNLESLLTQPLELENIDDQIAELKTERNQVDRELQNAESAGQKLVGKQKSLSKLEDKLSELEAKRESVDEPETGSSRDDLSDARAKRESIKGQIERLESSIERIEDRLEDKQADLDDVEVPDYSAVDEDLEQLMEKVSNRERDIELLRTVYTANKRVLDEDRVELLSGVERGLLGDSVECWLCGSDTDRDDLSAKLDTIQEQIRELERNVSAYRKEKRELESKKEEQRTKRREKERLESDIGDLESRLEERQESLERKRDSLESVEERVAELSESVSEQEDELTEVESDIKYTREKISDLESEIKSLKSRAEQKSTLQKERESLSDEIQELRSRRETMKKRTREAFSESISEIVDKFDTSYESARLTPNFDLVVARDGREVSLDALSEGEVVLLGIVAALAGFDAYEVDDQVPVILVDSLGGLTDRNLHRLVDYLKDRSERVVCTAYPEQSSFAGNEIDPAEWTVVSDDSTVSATN
ncbi:archaea-specific SMC-related protein [Haloarchaeobius sp. DYHT-AS-18]|uniref:archaea-specific SMC-related protein n=1 Tax=Haloarchaeobius sp. DYHT-AS-18 TaxID=3446117 RepID=UPI003EBAE50F